MLDQSAIFDDVSNPLDSVEELLNAQDWSFSRQTADELSVQVGGRRGQYRMTFIWQEEYSAMQFFCELDVSVPRTNRALAARAVQDINAKLWLGHFTISAEAGVPSFRHTSLFRGWTHTSGAEHVEDLVDIAIAECDRHYNVFSMLGCTAGTDESLLAFALKDHQGEA